MFKHPKLYITCSKSGKMTKPIMDDFMLEVCFPSVPRYSIVIMDSWTGQGQVSNLEQPEGLNIQIEYIPPGTTGFIQPCDVYFFRMFKTFIRMVTNTIKVKHADTIVSTRDNVLKMILLTHSQFQSPRFWSVAAERKLFLRISFNLTFFIF